MTESELSRLQALCDAAKETGYSQFINEMLENAPDLINEVRRLRAALEEIAGGSNPECSCYFIATDALKDGK